MTNGRNERVAAAIWMGAAAAGLGLIFAALWIRAGGLRRSPIQTVRIAGAVLRQNRDPRKQVPIANAIVTATGGLFDSAVKSDSAGFFELTVRPGLRPREPISLTFEHDDYKPMEIARAIGDQLYVARMEPLIPDVVNPETPAGPGKLLPVRNVRVRYTVKSQNTMNVGSLAKQFEVVNKGNVPCEGRRPCSPDGIWKANTGSLSLDAEEGNQFRNVRVTCIAGPCPFTKIEPSGFAQPARQITVSVLNWSDTASFLVEAEATRTLVTDTVRRSYPTIIGQTMTFALPAAAEGPTVEAGLDGEEIVFPLGPRLKLSWANCGVETAPGQNQTYRCELKPGYQFP